MSRRGLYARVQDQTEKFVSKLERGRKARAYEIQNTYFKANCMILGSLAEVT